MEKINVLDHGFVTLRNLAGPTRRAYQLFDANDIDPANAARMSFDQMDCGRTEDEDLRLANYLMKNLHTGPFEQVEVWVEMKLPIFVARQFVRHRTHSLNEVSGRYVQLPSEWYVPKVSDVLIQSKDKKQGGRPVNLDNPQEVNLAESFCIELESDCLRSYKRYLEMVQAGIAMEQARLFLHVNHYTHWIWKQDLHNMMHFLSLRDHLHAQKEAQYYAQAVDTLIRRQLPHSMELYDKYRRLA